MAADSSSSKILLCGGIAWMCFGATGLLLKPVRPSGEHPEVVPDARAIALFFVTFLGGEALAFYALLLAKRIVPAISPALAKKLACIPLAPLLLAHSPDVPLLGGTTSALLLVQVVGNGGAVGRREAGAAGGAPDGRLGAGVAVDVRGDGVDVYEQGGAQE